MTDSARPPSSTKVIVAYVLGALFFFYAFVQRVSPSIMTEELMRDFAVGGAALGVLSGTYFYTYAALQLPVGMLMDKFGPRKLMSAAALVCTLASFFFAYSNSLLSASLSRAVIGGSVAFAFVGTLTIASYFFSTRRFALAAGVVMAIGMCGAIVGQAPLRLLLELVGWRELYKVLSAVALVLAVLLFFIVPRRPTKKSGQQTDNAADDKTRSGSSSHGMLSGLRAVVTNKQSWLCAGVGFGLTATMLSLSGLWAVPWLTTTRGFSETAAASTASFMFVGFAIGSSAVGWLASVTGHRKNLLVFMSVLALLSLAIIVFAGIRSQTVLSLLFVINGAACGSSALCFALVRAVTAEEHNSTAMGLINMCIVGSGAVLQPFIGWLLDLQWLGEAVNGARVYSDAAYTYSLSSLLIATLLALVCCLLIREN